MKKKVGLTPDVITTSQRHPRGHISMCEKCIDCENCFILDPTKCKSGVIRALGLFGTNFTTTPVLRDIRHSGKVTRGSHHK